MPNRPDYAKANKHLDDPTNPEYWPLTEGERKALVTVKGQRRYTESKCRQARENREKLAAYQAKLDAEK